MPTAANSDLYTQVQLLGANTLVASGSVTFTASASAATVADWDVTLPAILQSSAVYVVTINNPCTGSALTVVVKNKVLLDVIRYPELTNFSIALGVVEGMSVPIQGMLIGDAARITVSNDSAIGAGADKIITIRVDKV